MALAPLRRPASLLALPVGRLVFGGVCARALVSLGREPSGRAEPLPSAPPPACGPPEQVLRLSRPQGLWTPVRVQGWVGLPPEVHLPLEKAGYRVRGGGSQVGASRWGPLPVGAGLGFKLKDKRQSPPLLPP